MGDTCIPEDVGFDEFTAAVEAVARVEYFDIDIAGLFAGVEVAVPVAASVPAASDSVFASLFCKHEMLAPVLQLHPVDAVFVGQMLFIGHSSYNL